ncbi:MAG: PIG-L family deacetylase [Planctomycetota bacterium]
MPHVFPPIQDRAGLPSSVLVLAAHPDDEIIGIGGLLAFHAARGDEVLVLHATEGGLGDPEGRFDDLQARRRREAEAALASLGLPAPVVLGFADGALEGAGDALADELRRRFAAHAPALLYAFWPGELHADHRALARAACAARDALPAGCRVQLYGVNQVPPFASLFDYSDLVDRKRAALACFETQLAYLDFATKVMQRDQAATVNVELPEITHCEPVLETDVARWPALVANADEALRLAQGGGA